MSNNVQFFLPAEDVNDETAVIALHFKSGDKVSEGESIYSFETTKAIVDVEAETGGYIYYYVKNEEEVQIGTLVCEISEEKVQKTKIQNKLMKKEDASIKPTKKAILFAKKNNLVIEDLKLTGIIKEKDLYPFIKEDNSLVQAERCSFIDNDNQFINNLLKDKSFKNLPSKEKIALYRKNGFEIGDNVKIGEGSILIGSKIQIGDNVKIGEDTYIESPKIQIGKNTSIGNDCEFVGSVIQIGEFNNISNKVYVDISGGRYPDSVLITGKGCLIADGCYINICRKVDIGENVALSPRSIIYTHSYWQSVLD